MKGNILILDDEVGLREDLALYLRSEGYAVQTSGDALEGVEIACQSRPDVILCDVVMPGGGATALLAALAGQTDIGVFVMTAYGELEGAVAAFRAGAADYLLKPLELGELLTRIQRFSEHQELRRGMQALRRHIAVERPVSDIVGTGARMQAVRDFVARIAGRRTTVFITGETGTGKDVVARAIHAASPWAEERFISVNCAAFPETLLESELFGHVRGAFTGAVKDKTGLFEAARGGTLFLDEIAETSPAVQAKLLHVVERHEITPIGSTRPRPVDLRIISATNRNLDEAAAKGSFRLDLLYRLRVMEVSLPPLREHREDIPALAHHFLERFRVEIATEATEFEPAAMRAMLNYPWPGNIRELRNMLERAAILCHGGVIRVEDLFPALATANAAPAVTDDLRTAMRVYEREHIGRVLQAAGQDKEEAARRLGVDLSTLYRKLGAS